MCCSSHVNWPTIKCDITLKQLFKAPAQLHLALSLFMLDTLSRVVYTRIHVVYMHILFWSCVHQIKVSSLSFTVVLLSYWHPGKIWLLQWECVCNLSNKDPASAQQQPALPPRAACESMAANWTTDLLVWLSQKSRLCLPAPRYDCLLLYRGMRPGALILSKTTAFLKRKGLSLLPQGCVKA